MGENAGKWGEMGENGEEHRKNESQCLQLHFLPASLGPLALVLSMADQVHPFKGVCDVPITAWTQD